MADRAGLPAHRLATARTATRILGAAAILAVGADHIEQYWVDDYRVIPTIGTLFLLLFIGSTVVGVVLLAPLERLRPRSGRTVWLLAALNGAGMAFGSLAGLIASEHVRLFGFMEHGYRTPIVLAIVSQVAATLALSLFMLLTVRERRPRRVPARPPVDRPHPGVGRA